MDPSKPCRLLRRWLAVETEACWRNSQRGRVAGPETMVDEWARGSSAFGQVVEYRYFGIHHRIGDAEVSVPGDDKLLPLLRVLGCAAL